MKHFKNFILVTTILVMLVTVFSGCNATQGTTTEGTTTEDTTTEGTTTEGTTEEAKPVTLSIAVGFANHEQPILDIAEKYKVNNPHVSVETLTTGANYRELLQTLIATGSYPEIALIPRGQAAKEFVDNDLLLGLTDRPVTQRMIDLNKETHEIDGELYAISTGFGIYGLIYNKEIFENAGIENPPRTLSELKTVVETLNAKDIIPFMPQFNTDWACGQFFQYGIAPILDINTGLVDNIISGRAKMTDSDSPILEVFNYIDILKVNAGSNPFNYDTFGNGLVEFAEGNTAMSIHGDWLIPPALELDPSLADKLGMVGIPWSEDENQNKLVVFTNDGYGIFKDSDNLEEGIRFFDFFFTNEMQDYLAEVTGGVSPMIGADNSWAQKYAQDLIAEIQKPNNIYGDLEFGKFPGTVTPEVNSVMQGYLADGYTKEQVMESIQNAIELGLSN